MLHMGLPEVASGTESQLPTVVTRLKLYLLFPVPLLHSPTAILKIHS